MELKDLKALEGVLKSLDGLELEEQARVLRWAAEKLKVAGLKLSSGGPDRTAGDADGAGDLAAFDSPADAISAAHAKTDVDRTLVAAAFLTKKSGKPELTGREINDALKELGHGVKNITLTITNLKDKKPQLMLQTAKGGKTAQAHKKYKVTRAGFDKVAAMMKSAVDPEEA